MNLSFGVKIFIGLAPEFIDRITFCFMIESAIQVLYCTVVHLPKVGCKLVCHSSCAKVWVASDLGKLLLINVSPIPRMDVLSQSSDVIEKVKYNCL